jgi:hypothetical protein
MPASHCVTADIGVLADLEARGLITSAMRRAGSNFAYLARERCCWSRFDPFRELFEALGGEFSPAAECAVAVLDLGWTLDQFAAGGYGGINRMSRATAQALLISALAALVALLPTLDEAA